MIFISVLIELTLLMGGFEICVVTNNSLTVCRNSTSLCDIWKSQLTTETGIQTHTVHHFFYTIKWKQQTTVHLEWCTDGSIYKANGCFSLVLEFLWHLSDCTSEYLGE